MKASLGKSAEQSLSSRRKTRFGGDSLVVTGELDLSRFRRPDSLQGFSMDEHWFTCKTDVLIISEEVFSLFCCDLRVEILDDWMGKSAFL